MTDVDDAQPEYDEHTGGAPTTDPADLDIWVAQAHGPGTQSVHWTPEDGTWTAVVMNADGDSDVDVKADVGATVPLMELLTSALWIGGAAFAVIAAALVVAGLVRKRP